MGGGWPLRPEHGGSSSVCMKPEHASNRWLYSRWDVLRNDEEYDFTSPLRNAARELGFEHSYMSLGGIQTAPYAMFEDDILVGDPGGVVEYHNYTEVPNSNGVSLIGTPEGRIAFWGVAMPGWESNNYGLWLLGKTEAFLDRHLADRPLDPFFIHFCSQAAHTPHSPPLAFRGEPVAGKTVSAHLDMVHELDLQVKGLVEALDARHLLRSTIVVFASDNGGLPVSAPVGHDTSNGLRGTKGSLYEGGHAVPMIVRWDGGGVLKGGVHSGLVSITDLFATLCDLVGVKPPPGQAPDSISFAQHLVGGGRAPSREAVYALDYHNKGNLDGVPAKHMLRQGTSKLLCPYRRGALANGSAAAASAAASESHEGYERGGTATACEFYELASDPKESVNLIGDAEHQRVIKDLLGQLEARLLPQYLR